MVLKHSLLLAVLLTLAACGVKPGALKAPEDADPQAYPKTYPSSK